MVIGLGVDLTELDRVRAALALGSSGRGELRLEIRGNLVLAEFRLLS